MKARSEFEGFPSQRSKVDCVARPDLGVERYYHGTFGVRSNLIAGRKLMHWFDVAMRRKFVEECFNSGNNLTKRTDPCKKIKFEHKNVKDFPEKRTFLVLPPADRNLKQF